MKTLILIVLISAKFQFKEEIYQTLNSNVLLIGQQNWMQQITKSRQNDKIIILHFYKDSDGKSYQFSKDFESKATEFKGIFIFGFVNCSTQNSLCQKENIKTNLLPFLRVMPPVPIPHQDIELDVKKAISIASKYIKHYITEINSDTAPAFLASDPALPKVLLFTDKEGMPNIYKALSNSFNKKLKFSIIRSSDGQLVQNYGIKKFPAFRVLKTGTKKPFVFEKEPSYQNLFEFLNVFSEQYAFIDKDDKSQQKPWIFESIPELTKKSGRDICFDQEKTLCVILFSEGKPDKQIIEIMKVAKKDYENNLDRSFMFKFMWIDKTKHNYWMSQFDVKKEEVNQIRIFNPGKRKRYMKMEDGFSLKNLEATMEKIISGDGRFSNLQKQEVPEFAVEL